MCKEKARQEFLRPGEHKREGEKMLDKRLYIDMKVFDFS